MIVIKNNSLSSIQHGIQKIYQLAQLPCACNNFPSSSYFSHRKDFIAFRESCWTATTTFYDRGGMEKNIYQVEVAIPISKCMSFFIFCHGIFQRVE